MTASSPPIRTIGANSRASGLRAIAPRRLADLAKLPVTTKANYIGEPDAFVLGAAGAADEAETIVWDIMYTTGRPRPRHRSRALHVAGILCPQRVNSDRVRRSISSPL